MIYDSTNIKFSTNFLDYSTTNYTCQDRTPFTYFIQWSESGICYYGVKHSKNCLPSHLMKTYFTSSKYVKMYIENYGLPDIVIIDKVFNNKEDAVLYEHLYLQQLNATKSKHFLNKSNGGKNFNNVLEVSIETRAKLRNSQLGKKMSESSKQKNREWHLGRTLTEEEKHIRKTKFKRGIEHHGYGKQLSNENCFKKSISLKKSGKCRGKNNAMYNKISCFDLELSINVLITKEEYDLYKNEKYIMFSSKKYNELVGIHKDYTKQKYKCPYCDRDIGGLGNFNRYHNLNCKSYFSDL